MGVALAWRVGVEMTPAIFWDGVMGVLMMEAGLSSVSPGPARLKKPNKRHTVHVHTCRSGFNCVVQYVCVLVVVSAMHIYVNSCC